MKTNFRIDGVMILTGVAVLAALGVAYMVKKKGAAVVDAVVSSVNPMDANNLVNKTHDYLGQPISSFGSAVTPFTKSSNEFWDSLYGGIDLLNPFNESDDYAKSLVAKNVNTVKTFLGGGTANVSPWYSGYQMENWEIDNPFGEAPTITKNPVGYVADKLGGDNKSDELTWRDFLPWNAFDNMLMGLSK